MIGVGGTGAVVVHPPERAGGRSGEASEALRGRSPWLADQQGKHSQGLEPSPPAHLQEIILTCHQLHQALRVWAPPRIQEPQW